MDTSIDNNWVLTGPPVPNDNHNDVTIEVSSTEVIEDNKSGGFQWPSLGSVLTTMKFLGAGAVAIAMALFLFEGIKVDNDSQRFFTILGFGGLLTGMGLAVNHFLQDRVASRLFLGLSLASITVMAAVLGGLIFSLTDAAQAMNYPGYATWKIADAASLWIALPIGLVVIGVVATLGNMVMARSEARWMTPVLLASNALVLIPSRDNALIAVITAASIAALFWVIRRCQVNPISFQTAEGRWALMMLFFAPVVLIGRTVLLYQPDFLIAVCLFSVLYLAARQGFHKSDSSSRTEIAMMIATIVTGIAAAFSFTSFIDQSISQYFYNHRPDANMSFYYSPMRATLKDLMPSLWAALSMAVMFDINRKGKVFASRFFSVGVTLIAALGIIVQMVFDPSSLLPVLVGSAVLALFMILYHSQNKAIEAAVLLVTLSVVLLIHLDSIVGILVGTGWWGLAAVGIACIVGGAFIEQSLSKRAQTA